MNNRDYPFVVKPVDPDEKDVKFIVQYLDFPGLSGGGDTIEEALSIAEEAKNMYLDLLTEQGHSWPQPTDMNVSGRITLRLPKTLHLKTIDLAERDNVSLNTFITDAIAQRVYTSQLFEPFAMSQPIMKVSFSDWNGIVKGVGNQSSRYDKRVKAEEFISNGCKNEVKGLAYAS
jgi:predicted HicB family RNase H-like nuclease